MVSGRRCQVSGKAVRRNHYSPLELMRCWSSIRRATPRLKTSDLTPETERPALLPLTRLHHLLDLALDEVPLQCADVRNV